MATHRGTRGTLSVVRQRGQAMVIIAFLVAIGIYALVVTTAGSTSVEIENRQTVATNQALLQARDALIGRSVSDNNRPGSLPCPDIDNDGDAESPPAFGGVCPSYVGRLPWRTLGLPDLRDGSGERLWYALSPGFRDHSTAEPINSDKKGTLAVFLGSATNSLAPEAVAVIFAPGALVAGQSRSTVAEQNNVANYLETAFTINNASGAGPYISAPKTIAFNDKLLVITTAELMTPVEMRVAREILTLLQAYQTSGGNWCSCYPWADLANGASNENRYWGRVPLVDAGTGSTPNWNDAGVTVPAWLVDNQWWWVFFYAVSARGSAWHDTSAPNGGTLAVDGTWAFDVVLITTGPAGATRPITNPPTPWNDTTHWPLYVDDAQNSDGDTTFLTPPSPAYARDRLYKL